MADEVEYPAVRRKRQPLLAEMTKIIIPAIATAIGAYYTARSESRDDTKASYETLAPTINDLQRTVERLDRQNIVLWQTLALNVGFGRAGSAATPTFEPGTPAGPTAPGSTPTIGVGSPGGLGHGTGSASGGSRTIRAPTIGGTRPTRSPTRSPASTPDAGPPVKLTTPDELFNQQQQSGGPFKSKPLPEKIGDVLNKAKD